MAKNHKCCILPARTIEHLQESSCFAVRHRGGQAGLLRFPTQVRYRGAIQLQPFSQGSGAMP